MKKMLLMAIVYLAVLSGSTRADETKVELKGTHLCCATCVKTANEILAKVDGVTGTCDKTAGTIAITAKDAKTAQKALDALAAGGFHGTTGNKDLKIADDSGVAKGKVSTLTLVGVHDCCPSCNKAIVAAVGKVPGVTGNTAKARTDTLDVTGDFDAEGLVKALNAAGFHVKVKK